MSMSSEAKATQNSGSPIISSPAISPMPALIVSAASQDAAGRLQVARLARSRPAPPSTPRSARPAGCRRRSASSTGPPGQSAMAKYWAWRSSTPAVEHHRRALGRVAELVRVGRHRGHAGQAEVERRHRRARASRAHGSTNPPRQASVWKPMPRDAGQLARAPRSGRSRRAGTRRRADDDHGAVGHRGLGRGDVGAQVGHRPGTLHELDAEVLRRLVERRVRGARRRPSAARDAPARAWSR